MRHLVLHGWLGVPRSREVAACHVWQVRELKEEIQILRGEGSERSISTLTDDERNRCSELVCDGHCCVAQRSTGSMPHGRD